MWTILLGLALATPPPEPAPNAPNPSDASVEAAEPSPTDAPAKKPWAWAALPIGNYTSDLGVGFGAYASVLKRAPPGSDLPYKIRFSAQLYWTTEGYQEHLVTLDAPSMWGSKWRFELGGGYIRWQFAPYFGVGNGVSLLAADDRPNDRYYDYDISELRLQPNLRYRVSDKLEAFFSWLYRGASVRPYDGSLLAGEAPSGLTGGRYSRVQLGLMVDTRDTLPDTRKGVFTEGSVRLASPIVGSQWWVFGANVTDRRYMPLGSERLVFANRAIVDARWGDEPFFMQQTIGGSQFIQLGGSMALRGFPLGAFRGDLMAAVTPELRWTFVRFDLLGGPVGLMLVPFVDVGRVWLWAGEADDAWWRAHTGGGLGFRINFQENMLIRVDAALGALRIDDNRTPNFGLYLLFDHPF